jgi:hypothetical protein
LALQPALAAEIAALKALPGMQALHEAACLWHREKLQSLLRHPATFRLYAGCLHAAGSAVLPPRLGHELHLRFQALEMPERQG